MAGTEKEQREVKSKLEKFSRVHPDVHEWTADLYDQAYELVESANLSGLDDPNDVFGLNGPAVVSELQQRCNSFEALEAKRRVQMKKSKEHEQSQRIENGKRLILKECSYIQAEIDRLSEEEWTGSTLDVSLNGNIFNTKSSIASLAKQILSIAEKLKSETSKIQTTQQLEKCQKMLQNAVCSLGNLDDKVQNELERRQTRESNLRAEADEKQSEAMLKEKQDRSKREKDTKKKLLRYEQESKRKLLTNAETRLNTIGQDLQHIIDNQKWVSKADEFTELQSQMEEQRLQELDELNSFENNLFGYSSKESSRSQGGSSISHVNEIRYEEPPPQNDIRAVKSVSKLKVKRQKRKQQKQEEEKRKRQEARKHAEEVQELRQRTEKMSAAQRKKEKLALIKKREEEIQKARSNLDEGEDDTEEEKRKRKDARKILMKHKGSVWTSCVEGDQEMLERYFLVRGTDTLLALHNYEDGGRTLLHIACWWGHYNIAEFLLRLGARVDEYDTALSLTTPLMEASRAGRKDMCELLIQNGASITAQDCHGDTALHWACRRGWVSLAISLVQWAESQEVGSTRGIFELENYKGNFCLDVAKSSTSMRHVAEKEFGIKFVDTEERKRKARLKRERRAKEGYKRGNARDLLDTAGTTTLMDVPDEEFQDLERMKSPLIRGLSDLGLDLGEFQYSRR